MSQYSLRHAFKTSLPVLFGYLPLGMAYGVVFTSQLDFPWWVAPLMSVLVYAGAAQLLAISLLLAMTHLLEVFLAVLVLNARHIFYGLSLLDHFRGSGWRKPYLIFGLTDETYVLLTSRPRTADRATEQRLDFTITAFNHSYWVLGSALGAWLGAYWMPQIQGIEFVLVALFIVLCIEQYHALPSHFAIWAGATAGLIAVVWFPEAQQLLMAVLLVGLALLWQYPSQRHR